MNSHYLKRFWLCQVLFALTLNLVLAFGDPDLLVVTVATKETDGYQRYVRSLKQYGFNYQTYGLGQEWKGGDVNLFAGGGQKVNILLKELEKYKSNEKQIILFTDSYDALLVQKPEEILEKFKKFDSRVVFGAEAFCWPDEKLESAYPEVEEGEKRFLNSGGFIGFASDIYEIISSTPIKDNDDDQLFYTNIFLNKPTREKYRMKLDKRSEIFQNLNGALEDVVISVNDYEIYLFNNVTKTKPAVIHGNGPSKVILNRLGNYLANAYSKNDGCIICKEDTIKLSSDTETWPDVTIGLFIEVPTPFLREFFEKISDLNYPKTKINVLIHNNVKYHESQVEKFFSDPKNNYNSIKYISPSDDSPEHEARAEAIQECVKSNCKYYFSIDSTAHLDNADSLKLLIEQNRGILAPVMVRKDTTWANIWGAVSDKGYYLRSEDYLDIINRNFLGVWNVPFVSEAVLINGELLNNIPIVFEDTYMDSAISFAANLRKAGVFMYATNMEYFGHLINPDSFNTSKIRPELYEIASNFDDWVSRYIRPEYFDYANGKTVPLTPCPDVFWFPVTTDEFCEDLITTMEDFGQWSGGNKNNFDPRLPGGYENVPTVDIHMTQVGFQTQWLYFLKMIIQPVQKQVFLGYVHDPPEASLNFVVRYRPGEQDHLTPHHDASTYTLNLALNTPKVDFEGGGVRFLRYNCSMLETRKGWAMIHPGRLTHYHEGLKVTGGTRYIMVSFIDP